MTSRVQQKMSYQLTLKCRSKLPYTKEIVSHLLYERFPTNFHRNDVIVVGLRQRIISPDDENIGQGSSYIMTRISAI